MDIGLPVPMPNTYRKKKHGSRVLGFPSDLQQNKSISSSSEKHSSVDYNDVEIVECSSQNSEATVRNIPQPIKNDKRMIEQLNS